MAKWMVGTNPGGEQVLFDGSLIVVVETARLATPQGGPGPQITKAVLRECGPVVIQEPIEAILTAMEATTKGKGTLRDPYVLKEYEPRLVVPKPVLVKK